MSIVSLNNLLNLSGKTAIVTGGAAGIGLGIVQRLGEAGANVVIADYNQQETGKVLKELLPLKLNLKTVITDVSSESDVKNLVKETVIAFGSIDILVNNAGIFPVVPLSSLTAQDFEKIINVNLKGVVLCAKYVSEQMIKQGKGGRIINITSIDALHPSMVGLAIYDASKHGVWGFTKNIALELAPHKIWVNAIAPGGINTPGAQKMQTPATAGTNEKISIADPMAGVPMHRMGEPDEIGKVALFLASDMSSYMTGSQIVVDGGFLLK
ncbi:SDR family oxidoreductase [Patescibacteria group bacterium]|nr:SDR family oxidoreductase [Patescibacteria group bacterium]